MQQQVLRANRHGTRFHAGFSLRLGDTAVHSEQAPANHGRLGSLSGCWETRSRADHHHCHQDLHFRILGHSCC